MWHKAIMVVRDSARTEPTEREIEVECNSMEQLLILVANELLRLYDGSASPHLDGLRGCLHVGLELTAWASSNSCAAPGEVEQQCLLAMRTSATGALSFGNGSPRLRTPTGRNGSCPKS